MNRTQVRWNQGANVVYLANKISAIKLQQLAQSDLKYNSSTLVRAHGVLRKKVKLDFIDGLSVKHRIGISSPNRSNP